jgi:hypothetical protein
MERIVSVPYDDLTTQIDLIFHHTSCEANLGWLRGILRVACGQCNGGKSLREFLAEFACYTHRLYEGFLVLRWILVCPRYSLDQFHTKFAKLRYISPARFYVGVFTGGHAERECPRRDIDIIRWLWSARLLGPMIEVRPSEHEDDLKADEDYTK